MRAGGSWLIDSRVIADAAIKLGRDRSEFSVERITTGQTLSWNRSAGNGTRAKEVPGWLGDFARYIPGG